MGLIVREAGKSFANAVAEVREAVDFLRYYAAEAERTLMGGPAPLGPILCISPWNFPLAIFTGQIAAALAAGNPVLAKPAEETPLIAAEAVRLLHHAGVPRNVLRLLPGDGSVGAALVADRRVQAVMFTGSTTVARLIHRQLAERAGPREVPLIAETGGLNALIADSSALAEQVVADVIASAFDSAGQRCSALRILCLQEEVADDVLAMLKGATRELRVGNPDRLAVDIGPVISPGARDSIVRHIETMRSRGHVVTPIDLPAEASFGTFVAPTIIEVGRVADVEREVFGPVLHVVRYRRQDLDSLIDDINAAGYGLTFGLHTRIDETIARVVGRIRAGNIYVNRNVIGAVVGVQPFGGLGLSGTGPKAGGPLYLGRLVISQPDDVPARVGGAASHYVDWLRTAGHHAVAACCLAMAERSALGTQMDLPGPVGERNSYTLRPRGRVACMAASETGLLMQLGAVLATGNRAVIVGEAAIPSGLPVAVTVAASLDAVDAVMFEGDPVARHALSVSLARREGPIIPLLAVSSDRVLVADAYDLNRLLVESSISVNTAAAGGNATLMTIG